jgi:chlorobactene glucosyltransferase
VANGKFMLFRPDAYQAVGGHRAVKDHATEDIALARAVRRMGHRTALLDATPLVSARMYSGLRDAVAGLSKNLFALFNYRVLVALFVWAWLLTVTWHPVANVAAAVATGKAPPLAPMATLVLTAGIWLLTSLKFGLPWHLFLLSPAIVTVSAFTGVRAIVLALMGRADWKGRRLAARRPRLI